MVATEASNDAAITKPCAGVMRTAGHSPSQMASDSEMYGDRVALRDAVPALSSGFVLDVAI